MQIRVQRALKIRRKRWDRQVGPERWRVLLVLVKRRHIGGRTLTKQQCCRSGGVLMMVLMGRSRVANWGLDRRCWWTLMDLRWGG